MKLRIVAVGGVRGPLRSVLTDYETRASRYWSFEAVEVEAGAKGRDPDANRVKEAEAERLLARIPDRWELHVLTREGKQMRSRTLARILERAAVGAAPGIAFVIGGAFGVADDLLHRARRRVSLSAMTLPHEMARLVLTEQIYRAGTILRNEPYHKGA